MTTAVLAVVLAAVGILADAVQPGWGDLAVLGTYALAMIVGAGAVYRFGVLPEREQTKLERGRTDQERKRAEEAEADARGMRDAFIQQIVPATTLQTERSSKLLDGLQQVASLVERVVSTTLGPK